MAVDLDFSRAGLAGQSITIECFVKPDGLARGDAWLAGKSRAAEAGAELSVLDVKEHFGAAGDGRTDDTAALNAAFEHLV